MPRRIQKNEDKPEFFPFTKELHKLLIKNGYTSLTTFGYIPDDTELSRASNSLVGYALIPNQHYTTNHEGHWVKSPEAEILVQREVLLPKHGNDPDREGMLIQSHMVGQLEEIMKVFGAEDELSYRHLSWWEPAPDEMKVTDKNVQFSIRSERIKEMYDPKTKETFYLLVHRNISKLQRRLWKKIIKRGLGPKVKKLIIFR
ncbi:MAG: hypothetical protein JNM41_04770 [Flavipsychrobacter sp.]|nr:hypothetical protein [Flavipsychrobacter sp.]